jgi:hypothetical protein
VSGTLIDAYPVARMPLDIRSSLALLCCGEHGRYHPRALPPGPPIIGGAEDKLRRDRSIALASSRRRIRARGRFSTASSLGDEATELYRSVFGQLGIP